MCARTKPVNIYFVVNVLNVFRKYSDLLKMLFDMVSQEKDRRVKDNIVAAVCRMIAGNVGGVPLQEVSLISLG